VDATPCLSEERFSQCMSARCIVARNTALWEKSLQCGHWSSVRNGSNREAMSESFRRLRCRRTDLLLYCYTRKVQAKISRPTVWGSRDLLKARLKKYLLNGCEKLAACVKNTVYGIISSVSDQFTWFHSNSYMIECKYKYLYVLEKVGSCMH